MRVFNSWQDWPDAQRDLAKQLPAATVGALAETYEFARSRHGDQTRPAGEPYTRHLLEVLEIIIQVGELTDLDALRAALLHDVVEDTPTTLEQVRIRFGDRTAELVSWLTKPEPASGEDPERARIRYLDQFATAPDTARAIKLADRYSNVQRLDAHPRAAKQRSYYLETRRWFLPLAASQPEFDELFTEWNHAFAHLGSKA